MSDKARTARDPFAFSLGGIAAKSTHVAMPAVADDRINRAIDAKLSREPENQPDTSNVRLPRGFRLFRSKPQAA